MDQMGYCDSVTHITSDSESVISILEASILTLHIIKFLKMKHNAQYNLVKSGFWDLEAMKPTTYSKFYI